MFVLLQLSGCVSKPSDLRNLPRQYFGCYICSNPPPVIFKMQSRDIN